MVVTIIYALLLLAVLLGLMRGGGPERIIAAVLVSMVAIDRMAHELLAGLDRSSLDQVHLAIDLAGLAAMVAVALNTWRYWPLWACSCQLISALTHLAWLLGTTLPMQVYLVMDIAPSVLISIVLIVGVVAHRRRLKRRGRDPSWKGS